MVTFLVALVALLLGFFIYSRIIERFFQPTDEPTPAITKEDGVDFMPLPTWKVFMIQLLNIAGLGPIFGALGGAMWGTSVYLWIVLGTIFAGGVHDYLSGMISLREGGKSLTEIVGKYLGNGMLNFMHVFIVFLMLMVGAVFTVGPAGLLKLLTGVDLNILIVAILIYYFLATLLPIDKIIGKLYPIFGICFIIMALGVMFGMFLDETKPMPELELANLHPEGLAIFPFMFITVACGAVSGFHSTQSPMMARCLTNEHLARHVFYGAMVCEGVIALIWAAAGATFYQSTGGLGAVLANSGASAAVYEICNGFMGSGIGMALAMIGVVVCPVTSGDTSLRSARLIVADWLNISQSSKKNRFIISLPLIIASGIITQLDFNVIWRYFAWLNQCIAAIVLWMGVVYMAKEIQGRAFLMVMFPAMFMTFVTTTYIIQSPEGLQLSPTIGNIVATILVIVCFLQFKKTCQPKLSVSEEQKVTI